MSELPLRPAPEDLDQQTVKRAYCETHRVVLLDDKLGRSVCPVCIVEDWQEERLNEIPQDIGTTRHEEMYLNRDNTGKPR